MKRWLLVLSRSGTVLVSIGLALLLVSLIPPSRTNSFAGSDTVEVNTFHPLPSTAPPFIDLNITFYSHFISTLTPQQKLKVELNCSDTIDVYIIKIDLYNLMNNFQGTDNNVALLEEFLQENPDLIGLQDKILEGVVNFVPTEVINATLIVSNPSSSRIIIEYKGEILRLLAPAEKVRTLAIWGIPIGFVLALPWLQDLKRSRDTEG
ncbi:hypothetical protein AC477_04930 [miscellaneous Crenarchaeota group-1 archaeon SG8-32-1]|uniref:Uncharacterized protein n=1 Tax=miscellaneous Crenarchaeota group-1 archaeon SG8-32-1 TaxID=1685124 RepID=A0A0M0BPL4_9ARCH|nr:MAG: hypothetical protein AC477_04930 [miscellaneous Crenarchaeota group-1 archaeon SG8-32-1]